MVFGAAVLALGERAVNAANPAYPAGAAARDRFVLDRRGPRPSHDPRRHQGVLVEDEPTGDQGTIARVATVFLTGRECPWRCVMCDLWQHTIEQDTPVGALPVQIAAARRASPSAVTQLKLYNAGSFFDPRAVPEQDYDDIASQLTGLSRVIVECHPALVGPRIDRFLSALDRAAASRGVAATQLEVAMGLETAHPDALDKLHKRFTLEQFARAAEGLRQRGVALRVFLLISPPFVPHDEQDPWLLRSIEAALDCGAAVLSLIPTRPGNGALDALAGGQDTEDGALFRPPTLDDIERSAELALAYIRTRLRVLVDVWDLERFAACASCFDARRVRLQQMNLEQRVSSPRPACPDCLRDGHARAAVSVSATAS